MKAHTAISSFFIVLAAASLASSAEPKAVKPQDKENPVGVYQVIHEDHQCGKAIAAFEKCFNSGDAKGLGALWTPNGLFQGPRGERLVGRKNIEDAFQKFFAANKGRDLELVVLAGRLVTDNVAIVDVVANIAPSPEGVEGEPRATIVLVQQDGRWLIDSIRETMSTAHVCNSTQLKDLEWMVGDWSGAVAGSSELSMHSTCDWTANRNFLIRRFSVSGKNALMPGGTEVIGWDPREHRIRSWIFEANGGFGESVWTQDGKSWTIDYKGILADGSDVSATQVLSCLDADTLTLQSTDRFRNGQKRPDVPKVTIKRCRAKEEPKPKPGESTKPPRQVLP
jgi:uncharacterized protein (TIGR02246 family)